MKKVTNFGIIHKNSLQVLSVILLISFFMVSFVSEATAQKTNFSGTWAFNQEKSNMGQQGQGGGFRGAGGQLTVKQEGSILSVERVRTNQNGEKTTVSEKYTLDGKESSNTSQRGSSKSIVKWLPDGKSLNFATTRSFERDGQTREMKSTDVWNLTDAKTLSITSTSTGRDGAERKVTLVYDKK